MASNVIVTGAASGIGLESVKLLSNQGFNILAFDIQGNLMRAELSNFDNVLCFEGDLSKKSDCLKAVEKIENVWGEIKGLLNWGATHSNKRWDELEPNEFNAILETNVTGAFLIAQAVAAHMNRFDGGSIVLTTSTSVLFGATGGNGQGGPAYVSSKGAIIALTRTMARSLAPKIRVNAVSPGLTETPMIGNMSSNLRSEMKKRFPLGRFARPSEIAEAGIFLMSEKSSFITGEILHVNGGSNFN